MSLPTLAPELSALLQGLDQNPDLFILIIDRHYRIIYANSAVQTGFDLDLAEMRGQSLLEVLYNNQKFVTPGVYISPIIEAVDTEKGRECFDFHMKVTKENGLHNWYNAGISVTHDAETGQVKYATGVYYRIQREKTLERELNGISWKIVHSFVRTLDKRDLSTGLHSQRVAELMVGFAQFLGMSKNKTNFANLAGVSHDIGKIVVPEQILAKPGKLNDAEYEKIKQHPVAGAEMIADIKELQGLVPVIRYHHERYDGGGHPEGLKGEEIPYFSRMLSLCDSFDAMTGERCYRKPVSAHDALKDIVKMSGTQFDPDLAKNFCCFIGEPLLSAQI